MALSRIVHYDREGGTVTYWCRDHLSRKCKQETVNRETFIRRMVRHILPKGFQRIRNYGLQATCKLKKVCRQLAVTLKGGGAVTPRGGLSPAELPGSYVTHASLLTNWWAR
jgi:hypothetical protein